MRFRAVLIASPPRCGSMWAYNVIRGLASARGWRVKPEIVPDNPADEMAMLDAARANDDAETLYVIKTHERGFAPTPDIGVVCPVRDPRDAAYSYRRFMAQAEPPALRVLNTIEHFRFIGQIEKANRWFFRYDSIDAQPERVVAGFRLFLGLDPLDDDADVIRRFEKAAVSALIAQTEAVSSAGAAPRVGGRAFHAETGFQSGHVSAYVDGDWRSLFSDREKAEIEAACGDWFEANGFSR